MTFCGGKTDFSTTMLEKLDIYMQNNKDRRPLPFTIYKKWVKSLNIKAKIIELLGKNIGKNLHSIGSGNDFFDTTSKGQATKGKNTLDYFKIKTKQRTQQREKATYGMGENIYKSYVW